MDDHECKGAIFCRLSVHNSFCHYLILHTAPHNSLHLLLALGVLEASFDYDNWLHDEGMNVVSKSLSLASKSLAQCATVQQTLQEW